jgi:hypothetical protein
LPAEGKLSASNFVLHSSITLEGAGWSEVPQKPETVGDSVRITQQMTATSQFYRLQRE